MRRFLAWILVIVNAVVLLGQVWPEGAPPFAPTVNIAFLAVTLVLFLREAFRSRRA